jgi:shikimate dehydrogenase
MPSEYLSNADTLLRVGLIGDPVAHSYSPYFQQAALDALGIPARYELWQTAASELPTRIASLRDPQCLGANVTIPHKEAVLELKHSEKGNTEREEGEVSHPDRHKAPSPPLFLPLSLQRRSKVLISVWKIHQDGPLHRSADASYSTIASSFYLDAVDPLAALIGAVNTIVNHEGYLYGYNTDAPGLLYGLAEQGIGEQDDEGHFSLQGYSVVLLGAGGAARAAAFALGSASVTRLVIVNRHLERAQRLAADVAGAFADTEIYDLNDLNCLKPHPKSLIINATPVGMHDDVSPLPVAALKRFAHDTLVFDMIYNPVETRLLREARSLGFSVGNGLSMLLHQGALAFTLWTGSPAPIEIMRSALWALQEKERRSSS